MNSIFFILLIYFGSLFLFEFTKEQLNLNQMSSSIPEEFLEFYDKEKYEKAQTYLKDKTRLHLLKHGLLVSGLLWMIYCQGFNSLDLWSRQFNLNNMLSGLIFIGVLLLFLQLISLIFSAINTFIIEEKYGFNKTTLKTFFSDKLIGLFIISLFGGGFFIVMMLIFDTFKDLFGGYAWVTAWLLSVALEILLFFIVPVFILPLFNKFSPLEEGELKNTIESFAETQNFHLQGLFTMNGSKRSTKANAFFTGFGKSRRIVLFDTLINNFTTDELVVILAHEIGHYKKKHITQQLILSIFVSGIGFFIFSRLLNNETIFLAFNMEHISIYASFILVLVLLFPLLNLLSIVTNSLSRKNEYEADQYAIENTGSGEAMISSLKNLSVSSLANLNPHPLKVLVDYTHPPVLQRINAIRKMN